MFPSVLTTFTDPNPSDRLNAPSHSGIETAQNTALEAVERAIGTDASTLGTIIGDLRNPTSDGGGHVQSANKGGTGQTSYAKGDLLVASSSSVLSKLSAGINGQTITADNTQAAGIRWTTSGSSKQAVSGSVFSLSNSTTETSILSTSISASTLGTNGAIRATLFMNNIAVNGAEDSILFKAVYGNSSVTGRIASITGASPAGAVYADLIAANATNAQRLILRTDLFPPVVAITSIKAFIGMKNLFTATASEDSGANKPFGITAQWGLANGANGYSVLGYVVEKLT